jgi:hypothetical protein
MSPPAHGVSSTSPTTVPMHASYTLRAVLVGLVSVIVLSVGTQFAELWIHGTQVTQAAPPINSFFMWTIIVVLVNTLLRLISRSMTLTRGELLLIYSMLIVCGGVMGIGWTHFIPAMITGPFYYGTEDQPWTSLVEPYIPQSQWFAPRNEFVIKYAFEACPPPGPYLGSRGSGRYSCGGC